ncbi:hypothetical protein [uncultured Vibrio sp.]|uniref:hypothetical protein n=1 Tax=uncultured Vibrio sp. TaxID=114054 RepID=UPI0026336BA5|nr:hypothetical protein [uncultured Vibrio sp.]
MGKLIIHIGMHKTGTTSIQTSLDKYSEMLNNDYGYFVLSRENNIPKVKEWLYPEWHNKESNFEFKYYTFKQIIETSHGKKNIIYSEENFSDEVSRLKQCERINKLIEFISIFPMEEVEVHIFFREQVELINSIYKQRLRHRFYLYDDIVNFVNLDREDFKKALDWEEYYNLLNDNLKFIRNKKVNLFPHVYSIAKEHDNGLVGYFYQNIISVDIVPDNFFENSSMSNSKNLALEAISKIKNKGVSIENIGWFKKAILDSDCNEKDYIEFGLSCDLKKKIEILYKDKNVDFLNRFGVK